MCVIDVHFPIKQKRVKQQLSQPWSDDKIIKEKVLKRKFESLWSENKTHQNLVKLKAKRNKQGNRTHEGDQKALFGRTKPL